jgi:hypothetical protein
VSARLVGGFLVTAFAVGVGHLAWHALVGPSPLPCYFVGGEVTAFQGPSPDSRLLYLRRKLYLSQQPRHAWLQVLARDQVRLYVNGQLVNQQESDGFTVGLVADLVPYLRAGLNVIAITAAQTSIRQPPVIAVEGGYAYQQGPEFPIGPDGPWRCNTRFERGAGWWYSPQFDEGRWPTPERSRCWLRTELEAPPRATTAEGQGRWITPANCTANAATVRRSFDISGRPRQAWIRVTTTAAYRLAVNGILVDEQDGPLAISTPLQPVRRLYDITPVVQAGTNELTLALRSSAGSPHLLADGESEDFWGRRLQFGTDEHWQSCPGMPPDWLAEANAAEWQGCTADAGDLDIPPWLPTRQTVAISLPWPVTLRRSVGQILLMVAVGLLTYWACRLAADRLSLGEARGLVPARVVHLALVLPMLAIGAAVLATYDPRVIPEEVYQIRWLILALLAVPAQWGLLVLAFRRGWSPLGHWTSWPREKLLVAGTGALLVTLVATGFWLRMRDIATEAMQWDEVTGYNATMGLRDRGFPSLHVHPDAPVTYMATSEIVFVFTFLSSLVFDDARYVMRFPPVCWSTLTIVLIYLVGRRLFGRWVGLVAAAVYTFSPAVIATSNFGRYLEQLQFLTLLSVYCYWLTIRGAGPIDKRALWLTAVGFIAMHFTWEGAALVAPGMMLAVLVQRRGRLRSVLACPQVWLAMAVVLLGVVLQYDHRILQQTRLLVYGTGLTDLRLVPMWRYGIYRPLYYVWEASWNQDTLWALAGLLGALLLAVRDRWRRPLRFLLLIHLATCLITAALLPVTVWRYIHHLVPLSILLASAALVRGAEYLVRLARQPGLPAAGHAYAVGVASLVVISLVVLGSGQTLQLKQMTQWRTAAYGTWLYKFPDLDGPTRYVREHMREGDVVLAIFPLSVDHLMARPGWATDYWPQSELQLQAMLDDVRAVPLDRRSGTPMLASRESLEDLFARRGRIWYIVVPEQHAKLNNGGVSAFLRQHMEVVYEDVWSMVLFHGDRHWPAPRRLEDEQSLQGAQANFLP